MDKLILDPVLIDQIARALKGIHYGEVQMIIHEGRVVQIERIEKWRCHEAPKKPTGHPEEIEKPEEAT